MKKKKEKHEKNKSNTVKSLRYVDDFFFLTNDFSLLEGCLLYLIAK